MLVRWQKNVHNFLESYAVSLYNPLLWKKNHILLSIEKLMEKLMNNSYPGFEAE